MPLPSPELASVSGTWWQYSLLFIAVTASWAGVPIVGAAAAGAAGVAASNGRLSLALVLLITTVAAEIGGLIGYQVGKRWGRELLHHPGKHQAFRLQVLEKGETAYAKWGRIAVFFTPSIVTGTAEMPYGQFVLWNLIDALGFALFTVAGAYGLTRILSGHHAARDVVVLIVGVAVGAVLLILVRRHHQRWAERHREGPPPVHGA